MLVAIWLVKQAAIEADNILQKSIVYTHEEIRIKLAPMDKLWKNSIIGTT